MCKLVIVPEAAKMTKIRQMCKAGVTLAVFPSCFSVKLTEKTGAVTHKRSCRGHSHCKQTWR